MKSLRLSNMTEYEAMKARMSVDNMISPVQKNENIFLVTPVPSPRMTQSDRWKQRPCVMAYRNFCDECRAANIRIAPGDHVIFYVPIPPSWSQKKRTKMVGTPHLSKPDIDNFLKALLDAYHENDSHIWDIRATKLWGDVGMIEIRRGRTLPYEQVSGARVRPGRLMGDRG